MFNRLYNYIFRKEIKTLLIGLDGSGKSTLLYKLKFNEIDTNNIESTIDGFKIDDVEYKNLKMCIWDISGGERTRPIWRTYIHGSKVIIFIIDSDDRDRMDQVSQFFNDLLSIVNNDNSFENCLILILANKQDLQNVMSIDEISNNLNLKSTTINNNIKLHIQPVSIINDNGINETFDWIINFVCGFN